jgi:hypothetical protein
MNIHLRAASLRHEVAAWIILGIVAHNCILSRKITREDAILLSVAGGLKLPILWRKNTSTRKDDPQ